MLRDVDDGHGVEHDADQQRADDHVAHAALAAGKPDAADHHHQHDVVEQVRVDDPRVDAMQAGRRQHAGGEGDQRRDHIAQHHHRAAPECPCCAPPPDCRPSVDVAAPFGEAQEQEQAGTQRPAKMNTSTGTSRKRTPPSSSTQWPGGTGAASCRISCERTKPKTKAAAGQRREDRRHVGIGDEEAVDAARWRGRRPAT